MGHVRSAVTLGNPVTLCLLCRLLHLLKHLLCLLWCQACIEKGEIDFLLFGKVECDKRVEAIKDTMQHLHLCLAHLGSPQLRPQCSQLLGQPLNLPVIPAHGRGRLRCAHESANRRVENALFCLSIWNELVRQESEDFLSPRSNSLDRG